jgi:hypothetical protein
MLACKLAIRETTIYELQTASGTYGSIMVERGYPGAINTFKCIWQLAVSVGV